MSAYAAIVAGSPDGVVLSVLSLPLYSGLPGRVFSRPEHHLGALWKRSALEAASF